jgi:crotonobetainyl-CoA:carnitine CoA-transferase CaiB-like acyl-CoA transferase
MQSSPDDPATENREAKTRPGNLEGVRVVEIADEMAEYCGLVLAGLGADVIKVEPPGGGSTRSIGPFFEGQPGPDRSLYFWVHNRNKRAIELDLAQQEGRERLLDLLADADVLLESGDGAVYRQLGLSPEALRERFPRLVTARATAFGDSGPWAHYKGSDLVHLALGGVMMNCGYDPDPSGHYDLPPIAPQLWHSYYITGEQLAIGIVAALVSRCSTGAGQDVSCAIHEAVSKSTELDLMNWVIRRAPIHRLTCRHAAEIVNHIPHIHHTKDGRWYIDWAIDSRDVDKVGPFLAGYGMAGDLATEAKTVKLEARPVPGAVPDNAHTAHVTEVIQRFIRKFRYEDVPWMEAQNAGLLWAPLRKPHENIEDAHWVARGTYAKVDHPDLGRAFVYPVSKWLSTETRWKNICRAPLLSEHTAEIRANPWPPRAVPAAPKPAPDIKHSAREKPFPLQNVRIFDFSWFLASAGGTKFLAALGAECLKVEWKSNPDSRLAAMAPPGGRAERMAATAPLKGVDDINMGGQFNNKNPGKRGLSLNIRHPRGLQIAKDLIRLSDVVAEGFSPGVLDRLGLGYDVLRSIRPDIIYVQQSGMGNHGTYGRTRTLGPVAAALSGLSEMSGLPEPAMPAGWGYSYLDWMGAYSFALATVSALHYREITGKGQWIDASQTESGLFLTGVPAVDHSAHGRVWSRLGNRSPHKAAAPHGAYRAEGEDRWIAIACFTEAEWHALLDVAGLLEWRNDPRFATLASRLEHQDALDRAVEGWTRTQDAYQCMTQLQEAGVAAGVCQTAEDRCDRDPQLPVLDWLTEVTGTKIGRWPVAEFPVKLSATPAYAGGIIDRGAPCYGEDNAAILRDYLGMTEDEIERLAANGVI